MAVREPRGRRLDRIDWGWLGDRRCYTSTAAVGVGVAVISSASIDRDPTDLAVAWQVLVLTVGLPAPLDTLPLVGGLAWAIAGRVAAKSWTGVLAGVVAVGAQPTAAAALTAIAAAGAMGDSEVVVATVVVACVVVATLVWAAVEHKRRGGKLGAPAAAPAAAKQAAAPSREPDDRVTVLMM